MHEKRVFRNGNKSRVGKGDYYYLASQNMDFGQKREGIGRDSTS